MAKCSPKRMPLFSEFRVVARQCSPARDPISSPSYIWSGWAFIEFSKGIRISSRCIASREWLPPPLYSEGQLGSRESKALTEIHRRKFDVVVLSTETKPSTKHQQVHWYITWGIFFLIQSQWKVRFYLWQQLELLKLRWDYLTGLDKFSRPFLKKILVLNNTTLSSY